MKTYLPRNLNVCDPRLNFDDNQSNQRASRGNLKANRVRFLLATSQEKPSDQIALIDSGLGQYYRCKTSSDTRVVELSPSKGNIAQRLANQDALRSLFRFEKFWRHIASLFRAKANVKGRVLNKARGGFSLGISGLVSFYPMGQYFRLVRKKRKKKKTKRRNTNSFINIPWMRKFREKKRNLVGYNVTGVISSMSRKRKNIVLISFQKKPELQALDSKRRLLVSKSLPRKIME